MRAYDCYNRDGKYIGIYYEDSVEELLSKHSSVYYIAGNNAIQSGKNWYEYSISDLELVRQLDSTDAVKTVKNSIEEISDDIDCIASDEYEITIDVEDNTIIIDEVKCIQESDKEDCIRVDSEEVACGEFIELSSAVKNLIGDKPVNVITLVSEIENLLEEIRFLRSQLGYPDIPD